MRKLKMENKLLFLEMINFYFKFVCYRKISDILDRFHICGQGKNFGQKLINT